MNVTKWMVGLAVLIFAVSTADFASAAGRGGGHGSTSGGAMMAPGGSSGHYGGPGADQNGKRYRVEPAVQNQSRQRQQLRDPRLQGEPLQRRQQVQQEKQLRRSDQQQKQLRLRDPSRHQHMATGEVQPQPPLPVEPLNQ